MYLLFSAGFAPHDPFHSSSCPVNRDRTCARSGKGLLGCDSKSKTFGDLEERYDVEVP